MTVSSVLHYSTVDDPDVAVKRSAEHVCDRHFAIRGIDTTGRRREICVHYARQQGFARSESKSYYLLAEVPASGW